jgi:hypothetical protein
MENNMELEKFNRLELSHEEMHGISGGNWWSDFKSGFEEGFNWATGVVLDILSFVGDVKTAAK